MKEMLGDMDLAMTNREVTLNGAADIQNEHRQFSPVQAHILLRMVKGKAGFWTDVKTGAEALRSKMKRPKQTLYLSASWVGWIAGFSVLIATWLSPVQTTLPLAAVWVLRIAFSILFGVGCFYFLKRLGQP